MQEAPPPPSAGRRAAPAERPRRGVGDTRRGVVAIAGLCAVLSVVVFLLAVVGFRQGWITYGLARGGFVGVGVPSLALLAVLFGLLGAVLALVVKPRAGLGNALAAVAIGGAVFLFWTQAARSDDKSPPVHDVATDWSDPLVFSPKTNLARGDKANPVELAPAVPEGPGKAGGGFLGRPVAEVNARTCPAATPVILTGATADAYARLKAAVRADRMAVLVDDPAGGRIEATAARGLWGVQDDLVGRVRPEGAGARVDLRSIARSGLTDDGANCARIARVRGRIAG